MPHIFLTVTAHGYGHLAQCAPVAKELARRIPDLRVTLQGDMDPLFVKRRLPSCGQQIREAADPGFLMDGPLVTRWEQSLDLYERFEAGYDQRLSSRPNPQTRKIRFASPTASYFFFSFRSLRLDASAGAFLGPELSDLREAV